MHEIFPQAKKNPPSGDESENIETVEDFIKYITKDKTNKPAPNPSDSDPEKTWLRVKLGFTLTVCKWSTKRFDMCGSWNFCCL